LLVELLHLLEVLATMEGNQRAGNGRGSDDLLDFFDRLNRHFDNLGDYLLDGLGGGSGAGSDGRSGAGQSGALEERTTLHCFTSSGKWGVGTVYDLVRC
jgi:hypothetical protein